MIGSAGAPGLPAVDRLAAANATAPRSVRGHGRTDAAATLRALADHAEGYHDEVRAWDFYGADGPVGYLESAVAALLGKPSAAFFPSGVMAQQVMLRIWCERAGTKRVALPELSHVLLHEEDGPRILHDLDIVLHTRGATVCRVADIDAVPDPLAAVLIELPLRDGGYLLPTWPELVAVSERCRERGIPLHVDGARLWESAPYWDRSFAEIAGLADSVYVSFYKGLGGLAGAALAADADLIDEARVWRRRMGGTLFHSYPYAVSALRGMEANLNEIPRWTARAKALAAVLTTRGITVSPNPPHTNAFRILANGPVDELSQRGALTTAACGVSCVGPWAEAPEPGTCFTEFVVGPATMGWDVAEVADFIEEAVSESP